MKPTLIKAFFLGVLLCIGCENPTNIPRGGSGSYDYLSWIQTMNKVRVTYSGMTNLHGHLKQSALDGGNDQDFWQPREMEFRNTDSTYTLAWQDSQFSTHSCFVFRQIDPSFNLSNDCGDVSTVRGVYHPATKSISDLWCTFQRYNPGADINSYVAQVASLAAPEIELESYGDDSVSFAVKSWLPGSVAMGYSYDERSYGTYSRQMQIIGYDTLGTQYPQACRVVFFKQ